MKTLVLFDKEINWDEQKKLALQEEHDERIALFPPSKWKYKLVEIISKLLNVKIREDYPYKWRG